MSDPKLTDDEVLEEVCRRRGGVSPMIQEVYEKYKHLDREFTPSPDDEGLFRMVCDMWQAIKAHVEEEAR